MNHLAEGAVTRAAVLDAAGADGEHPLSVARIALVVASIAAVAIVVLACVAFRQWRTGRQALAAERDDRTRGFALLQVQGETLQEQAALLQRQVDGLQEQAATARRAILSATAGGSTLSSDYASWEFVFHNSGRAFARNVQAWLAREFGPVTPPVGLRPIPPGGASDPVTVRQNAHGPADQLGFLTVSWEDEDGDGLHERRLLDVWVRE